MKRKLAFLLVMVMILSSNVIPAFAKNNTLDYIFSDHVTLEDIYAEGEKILYTSEVSEYYQINSETSIRSTGQYPIYTRVQTSQSSSNGLKQCSSKTGTYSSIASYALSFVKGIPAMRISQIFGAVSLAVGSDQYSQAKTFYSYVSYRKEGQAKWSSDNGYSTKVMSGKRNYYKHVMAGKKLSNGKWTTKTKDYLSSPAKTITGTYYTKSNSWFKEQAKQRLLTGSILDDIPW